MRGLGMRQRAHLLARAHIRIILLIGAGTGVRRRHVHLHVRDGSPVLHVLKHFVLEFFERLRLVEIVHATGLDV